MITAAASLLALTLSTDATWSIVVTQGDQVAASKVVVVALAKGVEAQPNCALGEYVVWKAPLEGNPDFAKCNEHECLKKLARDAGVDRLVALEMAPGVGKVHVQAAIVDLPSDTVTKLEIVKVAEDALDADAGRMAETICKEIPRAVEVATATPVTMAVHLAMAMPVRMDVPITPAELMVETGHDDRVQPLQQWRFGKPTLISAGVATSALVATGIFMWMGARQGEIVRRGIFPTASDRTSAVNFGYAMNVGAYVSGGVAVVAGGVDAILWLRDSSNPRVAIVGVVPGTGAHVVFQGEY